MIPVLHVPTLLAVLCVSVFLVSLEMEKHVKVSTSYNIGVNIIGYGSTLYIGIAMVFVFSTYIWKFTSCF